MKKAFVAFLGVALLCFFAASANAALNGNSKWVLHNAGVHDAKNNTCSFELTSCVGINVTGPTGTARHDIYVLAIDVQEVTASRYGLYLDGPFYFYGWTNCTLLELPTEGWPGNGEGNAHSMGEIWYGPHLTLGILDVYSYAGTSHCMSLGVDPRTGCAENCDGTEPNPVCPKFCTGDDYLSSRFGSVGFNGDECGYNPCSIVPTEQKTWGTVKSLYR